MGQSKRYGEPYFSSLSEEAAPNFVNDFGNPVSTGLQTLTTGFNPVFHDGILSTGPANEGGIVIRYAIETPDGTFIHSISVDVGQNTAS